MCLPMTATQKQLVEDYLDLVPRMVNAMTHPHTGTTAEEKEELCQIGYLALCRAASMCRPGSRFKPYAMAAIRHAFYSYWKGIARDRKFLCPLEGGSASGEDASLAAVLPDQSDDTLHPESAADKTAIAEYLAAFKSGQCSTIQKGVDSLFLRQQGYTSEELSNLYHAPANHIRAWQSKDRKLLRQDETLRALLT